MKNGELSEVRSSALKFYADNNLYQLDVDKPANYKDPYDYVTPHDKIIKATRTDFNNPRCKTLDRLGMGKFDSCKNIGELHL